MVPCMALKILVIVCLVLVSTVDAFTTPKPALLRTDARRNSVNLARKWPNMASSGAAGPATLEPETIEKVKDDKKEESAGTKMPAWEVRLFNDPFNKREFVARCLAEVCGKSDGESYNIMMEAHQNGMGIIGRYDFEIAELYNKSLKDNGLQTDMVPVDDE